jgi:hypothetical protein
MHTKSLFELEDSMKKYNKKFSLKRKKLSKIFIKTLLTFII